MVADLSQVGQHLYWPRVFCTVFVPTAGLPSERQAQEAADSTYRFDLQPINARLEFNNYNEADTAEVTFSYDQLGLDPRYLRSAEVYVYVADAYAFGGFTPGPESLRFVGIARDVERKFNESDGKIIRILAHDYTCLFLEAKSFPQSGVPEFSMTLTQAWAHVCDHTGYWDLDTRELQSTVTNLRDRLEFQGVDPNLKVGSAVPPRLAKLGKPDPGNSADAWAVWQHVISSLGLISYIRGDRCIVTTATDFYTADDPPRFLWGLNISEMSESRQLGNLSAKNVCARSYDPLAGKTMEALFPPPGLAIKKKRLGAKASKKTAKVVHTQDYECFDLPFAVADQATLDRIAQRIWEERTRQELRGHIKTSEMSVATANGSQNAFDLLTLGAGDQIQVEIERDALDAIQSLATPAQRAARLSDLGYSDDVVSFIVNNLDSIDKLPSQFLVHSVSIDIQASSGSGGCSYSMEIEYCNRLDLTAGGTVPLGAGAATNQAKGSNATPMAGQKTSTKTRPTK